MGGTQSKDIWVILEESGDNVKPVSLEALNAAAALAGQTGGQVTALALRTGAGNLGEQLAGAPLTRALVLVNEAFGNFNALAWREGIVPLLEREQPLAVLMGATTHGKELLPQLAARMGSGLLTDCIKMDYVERRIEATRPVFAGKGHSRVRSSSDSTLFVSIRPNLYRCEGGTAGGSPAIEEESVSLPDSVSRVQFQENRVESGKLDITEARVVVSGGMGMQGPENFKMLEELADALDGAVGASRPVVDEGWRPYSNQVGQTGRTVSPNLYIACGISGAIQHLAGMSSSQCIVAINKDADAPIYDIADYGIVGDALEIVPSLTAELKKILGS